MRKRKVKSCVGVVLVAAAVLGLLPGQSRADQVPVVGGRGRVYFVPIGGFPSTTLNDLVDHYKYKFGFAIGTLPKIKLTDAVIDYDRQQLISEELIELMKRDHPGLVNDPGVVLIGLTEADMYVRTFNWRFAFGFYTEGRFGVISLARMDPVEFPKAESLYIIIGKILLQRIGFRFDTTPDPELLQIRLRKMTTRYIGFMHYRLPPSDNRKSVLYRSILGLSDLDSIGEDF